MKKHFAATINWISYEKGGRKKALKEGARYCPLIRIVHGADYEEWSIDFICPDFTKTKVIDFTFLADAVPSHMLEKNTSYGIYEGSKKVAEIEIIEIY